MRLGITVVAAVSGLAFAGCGGGDDDDEATEAQTPPATQTETGAAGNTLTITMGDYSFTPQDATTKAGSVTIEAPNDGQVQHELVLLKTDQNPASLPLKGDEADEEALEAKGVESPGEIEDVGPGQTKSATLQLTPGKYVMICNLPGHFQRGMYGTLTAK